MLEKVNEDRNAVQNRVIALHREFAAAVADIVQAQVAAQVEERVSVLTEQRLAELVRSQVAPIGEQIQAGLAARDAEIAELRRRLLESDRNVLELMLSTGEWFRQAAGRLSAGSAPVEAPREVAEPRPPAVETPPTAPDAPPQPPRETANGAALYRDSELPGFAQPRKAAAAAGWSIPLVTSFLLTAGCVALLQYL